MLSKTEDVEFTTSETETVSVNMKLFYKTIRAKSKNLFPY